LSTLSSSTLRPWQEVEIADWEKFVGIIAGNILEEQTPQKLLSIRGQVYELLAACIPPDMIMQVRLTCYRSRIRFDAFYHHLCSYIITKFVFVSVRCFSSEAAACIPKVVSTSTHDNVHNCKRTEKMLACINRKPEQEQMTILLSECCQDVGVEI
jgi:hypothetical protein